MQFGKLPWKNKNGPGRRWWTRCSRGVVTESGWTCVWCIKQKIMIRPSSIYWVTITILSFLTSWASTVRAVEEISSKRFPNCNAHSSCASLQNPSRNRSNWALFPFFQRRNPELPSYLEEVVLGKGKSAWRRLFEELGDYFNKRFRQLEGKGQIFQGVWRKDKKRDGERNLPA